MAVIQPIHTSYLQSTDQDNPCIVLHKPQIKAWHNNPQIGCPILLGWYPMKCAGHGLTNAQIAAKQVCKSWIEADAPKTNQEKESGVGSIENRANIDYC